MSTTTQQQRHYKRGFGATGKGKKRTQATRPNSAKPVSKAAPVAPAHQQLLISKPTPAIVLKAPLAAIKPQAQPLARPSSAPGVQPIKIQQLIHRPPGARLGQLPPQHRPVRPHPVQRASVVVPPAAVATPPIANQPSVVPSQQPVVLPTDAAIKAAVTPATRREFILQRHAALMHQKQQQLQQNAAAAAAANGGAKVPLKAIDPSLANDPNCPTCVSKRAAAVAAKIAAGGSAAPKKKESFGDRINRYLGRDKAIAKDGGVAPPATTTDVKDAKVDVAPMPVSTVTPTPPTQPFASTVQAAAAIPTSISALVTNSVTELVQDNTSVTAQPATPVNVITQNPLDQIPDGAFIKAEIPKDDLSQQRIADRSFRNIDQFQKKTKLVSLEQIKQIIATTVNTVPYVSPVEYYNLLWTLTQEVSKIQSSWKVKFIRHIITKLFRSIAEVSYGNYLAMPELLKTICKFNLRNDLLWCIKENKTGDYDGVRNKKTVAMIIANQQKFADEHESVLQQKQALMLEKINAAAETVTKAVKQQSLRSRRQPLARRRVVQQVAKQQAGK